MGSFADDKNVRQRLREPFPDEQIGKLPASTKRPALDFVGHAAVSQRLNDVVPGWTYVIHERFLWDNECWVEGTMTIDGISRTEYGDGKSPKDAVGNFIRRAAMRFGVALDLWSRQELLSEATTAPEPQFGGDPATQVVETHQPSGAGSAVREGSDTLAGPARLQPGEEPVSDTSPPAASPEASSVEQAGGEAGPARAVDDPPAAPGDYQAPANEEQWALAREHIGAPPKVIALYEKKHGTRKKKGEITQLELAELIEDALKKVPA